MATGFNNFRQTSNDRNRHEKRNIPDFQDLFELLPGMRLKCFLSVQCFPRFWDAVVSQCCDSTRLVWYSVANSGNHLKTNVSSIVVWGVGGVLSKVCKVVLQTKFSSESSSTLSNTSATQFSSCLRFLILGIALFSHISKDGGLQYWLLNPPTSPIVERVGLR